MLVYLILFESEKCYFISLKNDSFFPFQTARHLPDVKHLHRDRALRLPPARPPPFDGSSLEVRREEGGRRSRGRNHPRRQGRRKAANHVYRQRPFGHFPGEDLSNFDSKFCLSFEREPQ